MEVLRPRRREELALRTSGKLQADCREPAAHACSPLVMTEQPLRGAYVRRLKEPHRLDDPTLLQNGPG